jgi:hypothetical protein
MWDRPALLALLLAVLVTLGNVAGLGAQPVEDRFGRRNGQEDRGWPLQSVGRPSPDLANPELSAGADTEAVNDEAAATAFNVEVVGRWPFGSINAMALDAARNLVFLGSSGGILVIDSSDASLPNPPKLAQILTPGPVYALACASNHLYVADGSGGLRIIDVSTPTAPVEVSSYAALNDARAVTLSGSYAYVLDRTTGLHIIDVSNPAVPLEVSHPALPMCSSVEISGSYAYLGGSNLFTVVDVSDPANPTWIRSVPCPGTVSNIVVSGTYAYVAANSGGLRIFSLLDPSNPAPLGVTTGVSCGAVSVSGDTAYLASSSGLTVVNVADRSAPVQLGQYSSGLSVAVSGSGSKVYLVTPTFGLRILDASNPAAISQIGSCTVLIAADIVAVGSLAYVVDSNQGLRVFDVSNPADPAQIGLYPHAPPNGRIAVVGQFVYLSEGAALAIIDVSNPAAPTLVTEFTPPTPSAAQISNLAAIGNLVYLATTQGLKIVDVTDEHNPQQVGFLSYATGLYDLAVEGNIVCAVGSNTGLRIIDVSNPASPVELGALPLTSAYAVAVTGTYAYAWCDNVGVCVIDVSIPGSPTPKGWCGFAGTADGLAASGSYLYLAISGNGLRIIDVSVPEAPTEVGFYTGIAPLGSFPMVWANGPYVYLTEGVNGFTILNHYATIRVNINPETALTAGARWRLDGGPWERSGKTMAGLTAGQHRLEFKPVPGHTTPKSRDLTLSSGQHAVAGGFYTPLPGKLTVILKPGGAVAAGAGWRVGKMPWKRSGETLTVTRYGWQTVKFQRIPGWQTPASRKIMVGPGQNKKLSVKYLPQP